MNEDQLFDILSRASKEDIPRLLDHHCGDDKALRQRLIDRLVAAGRLSRTGSEYLVDQETLAVEEPASAGPVTAPPVAATPVVFRAGATIGGKYELVRLLGEGGMGTVWLAEQRQPVRRKVALKLVRADRSTSRRMLARFEAERQAIALMDHPNIARMFEAGTLPDGTPFFAMELVQGPPITEYCATHRLSLEERLALFVQVCAGIQHAHQKGIIHRDLKPSNILVATIDNKPVPKVIDFGLAKSLTDLPLVADGMQTAFGTVMGTPQYMAPEQARVDAIDVDTRADVYSLGVILYELITGTTPISREQLRTSALDEVLRAIREREPPAPSSKMTVIDQRSRSKTPPTGVVVRKGRLGQRELDWIVLKALAKERERRYESASALAQDIQRFLNNEPVLAGPPSTAYRLRKFVSKYRGPIAAAALVLLALFLGFIGTTTGYVRAARAARAEREARKQAEEARILAEEARKAEAERAEGERRAKEQAELLRVRAEQSAQEERLAKEQAQRRLHQIEQGHQILMAIFDDLDIAAVRRAAEPLEAALARRLVQAAQQLEGESIGDRHLVATLQNRLGLTLLNLGYPTEAVQVLQKAHATLTELYGPTHQQTIATANNLALAHRRSGNPQLAVPLWRDLLERIPADANSGPDRVKILNNLAYGLMESGDAPAAVTTWQEALDQARQWLPADDPQTLFTMANLGRGYLETQRLSEGIELLERTLRIMKAALPAGHPFTLNVINNLSNAYRQVGQPDRALSLAEEACQAMRASLGADHPDLLNAQNNLALAYRDCHKVAEAVAVWEELLPKMKVRLGAGHPDTLVVMNNLALGYRDLGRDRDAIALWQETVELARARLGDENPQTLSYQANLASAYIAHNQPDLGVPRLEQLLPLMKQVLGPSHPETIEATHNLAEAYLQMKRPQDAIALWKATLSALETNATSFNSQHRRCLAGLATAYQQGQDPLAAVDVLQRWVELAKKLNGDADAETLRCQLLLARTYQAADETEQAVVLLEQILPQVEQTFGAYHPETLDCLELLATTYQQSGYTSDAMRLWKSLYQKTTSQFGAHHVRTLRVLCSQADCCTRLKQFPQAVTLWEELAQLCLPQLNQDETLSNLLGNAIRGLETAGAFDKAESWWRQWLSWVGASRGTNSREYADVAYALAENLFKQAKYREGSDIIKAVCDIRRQLQPDTYQLYVSLALQGRIAMELQEYSQAEPLLTEAYRGLSAQEKNPTFKEHQRLDEVVNSLVELYTRWNKPEKAEEWMHVAKLRRTAHPRHE